jgi:hypothetical protein
MNLAKRAFPCIIVVTVLVLASCESVPPRLPVSDWFALLPKDESVYVSVRDCTGYSSLFGRVFRGYGLEGDRLSEIVGRTERALVSYGKATTVALVGRYPSFAVSAGFSRDGGWKRIDGKYPFWTQEATGLSVANPHGYLLLATGGDIANDLVRVDARDGCRLPADTAAAVEAADLACWVPSFGPGVLPAAIPFNREKVPLADVLVTVDSAGDGCVLAARFGLSTGKDAARDADARRVFTTSLRTFVVWLARNAGVTGFVNRIVISEDDRGVSFRMYPCIKEEIDRMIGVLVKAPEEKR